jgi:hypothetical protein
MTVIKQYNAGTSAWETIVVGKQGPRGFAGVVQSATAPEDTSVIWLDTTATPAPIPQPMISVTDNYSFLNTDAGKFFVVDDTDPISLTVNGSLDLSPGQSIDVVRWNTGTVTFVADGATVNGTPALKLRARYSVATLICVEADVYLLAGDLAAS